MFGSYLVTTADQICPEHIANYDQMHLGNSEIDWTGKTRGKTPGIFSSKRAGTTMYCTQTEWQYAWPKLLLTAETGLQTDGPILYTSTKKAQCR